MSLTVSPFGTRPATMIGASAIARDITEQNRDIEQLRDSEARLRSIVESAVDGIIVIDAAGIDRGVQPGRRAPVRLYAPPR